MKRLSILFVLLLLLAACGDDDGGDASATTTTTSAGSEPTTTAPPTDDQQGGDLRVALIGFPEAMDPLTIFSSWGRIVAASLYDTLLTIDESGELQPYLATSWDTTDDGATWVLELRDGVTFHDGAPFDAAAVVAHSERLMDPANECRCLADIGTLQSVEATGDMEVTYTLEAPKASFPALLAGEFGMVAGPSVAADNPVGTGPFVFVESREDESYTVSRNTEYWQEGLPYLDSITFQLIPDVETRLAALRTGEIDVVNSLPFARWQSVIDDSALELIEYAGLGSVTILLNHEAEPFDDPEVRRAVSMALDLETLHETLNGGMTQPATSIFPRGTWAYPGEIDAYPTYDPDAARAIVESVGPISFTLLVPGPTYYEQAVAAQAMWAEVGIEVDVQQGDAATVVAQYRAGDYQASYTSFSGRIDPQVFAGRYASTHPANDSNISDAELDDLVAQADLNVDRGVRADLYRQIAERAAEILPFIIVSNLNDAFVSTTAVNGIPATPDGVLRPATIWLDR